MPTMVGRFHYVKWRKRNGTVECKRQTRVLICKLMGCNKTCYRKSQSQHSQLFSPLPAYTNVKSREKQVNHAIGFHSIQLMEKSVRHLILDQMSSVE